MKTDPIKISTCPTCGSDKIRRVTRDLSGAFKGLPYTARKVTFEECPVCNERLYGPSAMEKISAAQRKLRPIRKPKPSPQKHRASA